jgi:hypothetical protein
MGSRDEAVQRAREGKTVQATNLMEDYGAVEMQTMDAALESEGCDHALRAMRHE